MRIAALACALAVVAGCVSDEPGRAPQSASGVRTFGKWPEPDNAARTGTTAAIQSYTPVTHAKLLPSLRPMWSANVGKTDHRTTMAVVRGHVIVGTHGASHDAKDEAADAVYVVDGTSGAIDRRIAPPGAGDRDVNGIAVDGNRVFFSSDDGEVTAATIDGKVLWSRALGGVPLAAPTLADANGDGVIDAIVGDDRGTVHVLDGRNGRTIWSRATGASSTPRGIEAGIAAGDIDGDGTLELVVASHTGAIGVFHADTGEPNWVQYEGAAVRASPLLVDLDADGKLEVLVGWSNGTTRILDGKTGAELWSAHLERDDGGPVATLGASIPLMGPRIGAIVAPIAREQVGNGVFVVSEHLRTFRSADGAVSGTPVVAKIDAEVESDAIYGTSTGDVIALDATGGRAWLANVGAPIASSPMLADTDGDGDYELLVAAADGRLTCFATSIKDKPAIARFRGDSPHNTGVLAPTNLGWSFARGRDVGLLRSNPSK